MNYFAINTAAARLEILACKNGEYRYVIEENAKKSSEILLTQIEKVLIELDLSLDDLDFIGCVIGPGSFTGIRIGVTTVRNLCYALKKKALSVNYLDLLAYNKRAESSNFIVSAADASNGFIYVAAYGKDKNIILPYCVMTISEFEMKLKNEFSHATLCCDDTVSKLIHTSCLPLDNDSFKAVVQAKSQFISEYHHLEPLYIRLSQAEMELMKKEQKGEV